MRIRLGLEQGRMPYYNDKEENRISNIFDRR